MRTAGETRKSEAAQNACSPVMYWMGSFFRLTCDESIVGGLLFGRDLTIGIDVELRAGDAEGVSQEGERIARS